MAKSFIITPEILRKFLRYEPNTGCLFWRERDAEWFSEDHHPKEVPARIWNSRWADAPAFRYINNDGYHTGRVFGRDLRAHRVIWAVYHDAWPPIQIDHANGVRTDNRISNLRLATHAENQWNRAKNSKSLSKYKGVSWDSSTGMWDTRIMVNGVTTYFGRFATEESAAAVYREAATRLHGKFLHPD